MTVQTGYTGHCEEFKEQVSILANVMHVLIQVSAICLMQLTVSDHKLEKGHATSFINSKYRDVNYGLDFLWYELAQPKANQPVKSQTCLAYQLPVFYLSCLRNLVYTYLFRM